MRTRIDKYSLLTFSSVNYIMRHGHNRMAQRKTTNLNKAFGIVVARHRKGKWTQEGLGFEADLTRAYISLLERGQASPSLHTIYKLAEAFGMNAAQLVELTLQELSSTTRYSRSPK